MNFLDIKKALQDMCCDDGRPVVVYSAVWPFMKVARESGPDICSKLLDVLLDSCESSTFLMPTFTGGFQNGVCDLDIQPSSTGALTEFFRVQRGVRRSVSAFFSFAVYGKEVDEIIALRPRHAWGEGSLYEWLYQRDAHIVTLGLHPTHCSFTHYAEWICRDVIPYRHEKTFEGKVVLDGNAISLQETLLVRCLNSSVINDFTWLLDLYLTEGEMKQVNVDGIHVSAISAKRKIDLIVNQLKQDPLALLQDKERYRKEFGEV